MRFDRTTSAPAGVVFLFLSCAPLIWAQAPVEDRSIGPGSPAQLQAEQQAQEQEQSATIALYLELQTLRTEVSLLRGLIEESNYEIQRLQSRQATDYANLDARILGLNSVPAAGPSQASGPADTTNTPSTEIAPPQIDSETAADQYRAALDKMRAGDREGALEGFRQLIGDYPTDPVVGDAYYWVGQTHWVADENEEAREAFTGLVNGFKNHRRYGEALNKLAEVYIKLNDQQQAETLLLEAEQLGGDVGARASELLEEFSQQQI
ncbi:MAG: tetratricopeptide repeat protein [Porticoccaceae bacterium]|jgi:TolA-binding protein|nr:tetratricopeptide repeat protein [Porticoccaceae bacterium]